MPGMNDGSGGGASTVTISNKPLEISVASPSQNKEKYILDTAARLFANANLNSMDGNGNLSPLPDSKIRQIAKNCVKYAKMLADYMDDVN